MDRRLLNKLKFHLGKVLERYEPDDWANIVQVLDQLAGQAPDERQLAVARRLAKDEALLRAHALPGDAQVLLRELEAASKREPESAPAPMTAEQSVARALRGRALLVIGGDPRENARERMQDALGIEVLWPLTREDAPDLYALEPLIARPQVGAVALLIRFIRHALNDVATLCERHDKPLARVLAGYNPTQVATSLVEQCGKRLGL